ncbi:hypothetical protein NHE_0611 [Neorickettsia helminthoeca str. Oregon]|uniref:Invasion associated locus B family protein n=1 Tax=Neorickettsia helminthoeca str. Oregon TaxID=1286528 RepID=X5H4R3_9RICK|nr:hypothetical protein [Neorickettsia helminthoeca]AHX11546.1 hypothetical protein NHE_0611 [Neorickettsia helminthoeca str. Oregon]
MKKISLILSFFCFFQCFTASAESPKALQSFENWTLYTQIEDGQKVYFIAATPVGRSGNYTSRGAQHIWVRCISKNIDEVSITPGYPYKGDYYPQVATYKKKEDFLKYKQGMMENAKKGECRVKNPSASYVFDVLDGDIAWLKNVEDDENAIKSMKSDIYAVVVAKSRKGTCSLDLYSLKGFAKAHNKMKELCEKVF